jgi:pimeloyl-ACP methyl ester carboxylesterase
LPTYSEPPLSGKKKQYNY